jgi:hypothetical protein
MQQRIIPYAAPQVSSRYQQEAGTAGEPSSGTKRSRSTDRRLPQKQQKSYTGNVKDAALAFLQVAAAEAKTAQQGASTTSNAD